MSRQRFLFILTLIIAAALRFVFLGWKPPHFDESINGWFISQVWEKGYYDYDPNNFHGPLYFYYLQLFELLFGKSVQVMRTATGLLSLGAIYLTVMHRRFVGNVAYWAALFVAISPAFVFYSRYAIHETLFIFAQILFSYGFWSWRTQRNWLAYAQMAVGVLILASTKETFFIFLGTWAIALFSLPVMERILKQTPAKQPVTRKDTTNQIQTLPLTTAEKWRIVQVTIACGVVLVALFSNLFADLRAFSEFFSSLAVWTKTGAGKSGHEKPFVYWLQLLIRYEWPILISLVLTPVLIWMRGLYAVRILALVGFGTWLAYSIIPYKTPWLVMGMIWPLAFVAGWVIEQLRKKFSNKLVLAGLAIFLISPLVQTYRLNFIEFTNDREPYVYVQSTKDINVIIDLVNEQIKRSPADLNMRIIVMTDEGWPFPWVFGGFPHLQYMKLETLDAERFANADVIFYDGKESTAVEDLLKIEYYRIPLQLRSAYHPGFALFRVSMFAGLLPKDTLVKGARP